MALNQLGIQPQLLSKIPLKIVVNKKTDSVLFAEAGKDFVDVLLSFLTLPLGTIARLVSKVSNMEPLRVGCLSSLYESVANLKETCFWTNTCKDMLLNPRNSMESYCQYMKLNIDDTQPKKFFICEKLECSRRYGGLLSSFRYKICKCGLPMNREIRFKSSLDSSFDIEFKQGYVPENATFIIFDNLKVMPYSSQTSLDLPMNLAYQDFGTMEEVTVNVTKKEVMDLLKCSLLSKTPLTDTFLHKKEFLENSQSRNLCSFQMGEPVVTVNKTNRMLNMKVMVRKSNGKILFALAEEDVVDFLFSFLCFPLGGVEHMLKGNSCLSSIDNLYKSIDDLFTSRSFCFSNLQDKLINPKVASQFNIYTQILPIGQVPASNYSCYSVKHPDCNQRYHLVFGHFYNKNEVTHEANAPLQNLDPKSSTGETDSSRGFCKGPSVYMVTDDLVVTPSSFTSTASFLHKSRIPAHDLEERVVSIGVQEGLSILKASLISSSALTIGLSHFMKTIKEEN